MCFLPAASVLFSDLILARKVLAEKVQVHKNCYGNCVSDTKRMFKKGTAALDGVTKYGRHLQI